MVKRCDKWFVYCAKEVTMRKPGLPGFRTKVVRWFKLLQAFCPFQFPQFKVLHKMVKSIKGGPHKTPIAI